jgi:saccharopine dehydrogenase (NADP+, L-glutamate forming)
MKNIFIIGAGLSTPCLIKYLTERSEEYNWNVTVGDISKEMVEKRLQDCPKGKAVAFDVFNDKQRASYISKADLVISMLPARMHYLVAKTCIRYKKDMVTASYVSDEVREFHQQAKENGTILLNEIGLDPGIDHMSAMRIIDEIKNNGGKLTAFFSYTGGLVAPEYDNNPWNYKFTWNPRNVVLAGQGVSKFIRNGRYKYIPYTQLFSRIMTTSVDGYGDFEIYPNRDSLSYRETYNLTDIPTIFRGTMRRPGYAKAWNVFVQLGATDDSYVIEDSENMTYRDFINTFLPYEKDTPVEEKIIKLLPHLIDENVMRKLNYLEIFSEKPVGLVKATPAKILQKILEEKWQLEEGDRDMIVMQHRFEYTDNQGNERVKVSSLVVEGETREITVMAKPVGLPLAIAVKLVATGKVNLPGVQAPVMSELYNPILDELKTLGIDFIEKDF